MNEKIINDIVWWIPIKKLRNNIRNYLINREKQYQLLTKEIADIKKYLLNVNHQLSYININLGTDENKRKEAFTNIYRTHYWGGGEETRSGSASLLSATVDIIKELIKIINKYNIKSILDCPCGDFNWMKEIVNNFDNYIGVDIVDFIIEENKKKYSKDNINFYILDICEDSIDYDVDLIFSRDCVQHLTTNEVIKFINNIKKSKAKYLLISTSEEVVNNLRRESIPTDYININFELEPFNFPKPLYYFIDNNSAMGLWEIKSIK